MRTLKAHLEDKLRDERFRELYLEEQQLAQLSMRVLQARKRLDLTQQEVAAMARITQQQLSRVENGANCNVSTFLKVCNALGVTVALDAPEPVT